MEAALAPTECTMVKVDAASSSIAKDNAAHKSPAIVQMETIAGATPFVLPRIQALIGLFAELLKASIPDLDCVQEGRLRESDLKSQQVLQGTRQVPRSLRGSTGGFGLPRVLGVDLAVGSSY